jgi:phenylpyruvate tautomerase PptA (4-oxalocrotonate tautomerase family)
MTMAAEITQIHSSITGAPTSFVHLNFHEQPPDPDAEKAWLAIAAT